MGSLSDGSFVELYLRLAPSVVVALLPPVVSALVRLLPAQLAHSPSLSFFAPFLSLSELYGDAHRSRSPPPWKLALLTGGTLLQTVSWLATASFNLIPSPTSSPSLALVGGGLALVWASTTIVVALTVFSNALFRWALLPPNPNRPWTAIIAPFPLIANLSLLFLNLALLLLSLSLPIQDVPLSFKEENKRLIAQGGMGSSPEDFTSLWKWISFSWTYPLIRKGKTGYMQDEDVYLLSPLNRAGPLFDKFRTLKSSSLLWRIIEANGFDIAGDAVLTLFSVVMNYCAPYFIKQVLQALSKPTAESLSRAFVYATLAFLASLAKSQSDVQHLWLSRRACVRIKSELTSAIYDKALRRRDASGVGMKKGGSAGVGKVVNLMAGDTNRIGQTVASLYMFVGAPLEVIVATTFLFSLLSWSSLAGIAVILLALPLNKAISSRSVRIQRRLLARRDERLNVMNELIGGVKYVKYSGSEPQWRAKVLAAREAELKVMVEDRINSIYFTLVWVLTPMLVTIASFFSYIRIQGGTLTLAQAFTALMLYTMLRNPLAILPRFTVVLLQSVVAVQRIDDFLQEDEVPTFASSLKIEEAVAASAPASVPSHPGPTTSSEPSQIGFSGSASFRWNAGKATPSTPDATAPPDGDDASETVFELADLDLLFPVGKLTVITGSTGSGKTALLHALLGEMEIISGHVHLPKDLSHPSPVDGLTDSVAYAGQTPWLQGLSIRENILFGSKMDRERYSAVLEACCLGPDLRQLEDGERTEIGTKGVSLSGGQKARVALARALYSRARHVLLDDPLAAVDAHTAASLVSSCLAGPLLAGRTVLIVSHHVELLLPIAHSLVRIVDGRVEVWGEVKQLREEGKLAGIVAVEQTEVASEEAIVPPTPAEERDEADVGLGAAQGWTASRREVTQTTDGEGESGGEAEGDDDGKKKKKQARKLVKDEAREVGNVQVSTYGVYLEASSYKLWAITLTLLLIAQNSNLVEKWWIGVWTSAYSDTYKKPHSQMHLALDHSHALLDGAGFHQAQHAFFLPDIASNASLITIQEVPSADEHPLYFLGIYSLITLGAALLGVAQTVIGFVGAYRASRTLHDRMLNRVIRSTSRWFDTTPAGRIVNRFSRDLETIDGQLAQSLRSSASSVAGLLGQVITVAFVVPPILVPGALVTWTFWHLSVAYVRCGRDLRRMEATARSPIISGFSETLEGIVTLRAFSAERRFIENVQKDLDKSLARFYFIWMLNRWLLLRLDVLGALTVFMTSCLALSTGVSGTYGAIAITSAQGFVQAIYWTVRFYSQLEMDANSIERIEEYLRIPQEPPAIIDSRRPPAYWPSASGETLISVTDLVLAYDPELPPVLHGISCDIKPREKIGLVGRTGSGKSTLAMALLRFADPSSGTIVIDGIDITTIGLQDLRSRLTLIPQEAVLFSGTIRENLDPFNEHTDEALLDALARVQLGGSPTSVPSRAASSSNLTKLDDPEGSKKASDGDESPSKAPSIVSSSTRIVISLETEVSAGGANFSHGTRQLLAMARALLRRSSIIIMDEATASVDFETDTAIQRTIREEFSDSCLITIAHRLSSIVDYDRILVLDHGHLKEFASPYELLQKTGDDALFRAMCEKTGKFKELRATAEAKSKAGGGVVPPSTP